MSVSDTDTAINLTRMCFMNFATLQYLNYSCVHNECSFQEGRLSKRLFYLSIPPNIFVDVVRCASTRASSKNGWTRVIVEKPFGRDSESSGELTRCLKQYLAEDQIFRYIMRFPFRRGKVKDYGGNLSLLMFIQN